MPSVVRGFKGSAGAMFRFKVTGAAQLIRKLDAYGKKAENRVKLGIRAAIIIVEAEAKRLVKSGNYYQPPYDTGLMRGSIGGQVISATRTKVEGAIGVGKHYGIYVHEGTKYMEQRPFLTDALEAKRTEVLKVMSMAFGLGGAI